MQRWLTVVAVRRRQLRRCLLEEEEEEGEVLVCKGMVVCWKKGKRKEWREEA